MPTVHLGNACSLVNAIEKVGKQSKWVKLPADVPSAEKFNLHGLGHFGHYLSQLDKAGYTALIREHIETGKPFIGIYVGLQALFKGSEEDPEVKGLGLIPERLRRFCNEDKSIPHISRNSANTSRKGESTEESLYRLRPSSKYYYAHLYTAPYREGLLEKNGWTVAIATYGNEEFIGAIVKDNMFAT